MSLATAWSNAGATRTRTAWLLAATPVLLLLTHYAAVLPHEFAHSFVAWFLDIKPNPLIIDWGGSSILNILLLINLANLYCYVPMRVFASDGDVDHFRLATGISPWVIYVAGGYLVVWAMVDFYRVVLPHALRVCDFIEPGARAAVLVVATAVLFGYFAIPGLEEPDARSLLIARTSLLAIPVVLALMWYRTVMADSPRPLPERRDRDERSRGRVTREMTEQTG